MYTIFNPWKGFPSANAIYLDNDFQRMRANGQLAFGTAQEAYDAANATGVATVIMVGKIDSTQSLDVTLIADYNVLVSWVGINPKVSQIRSLIGSNGAGAGRNITIDITNVLFDLITSVGTGLGGQIIISSFGKSNINTISSDSNGIGGGSGGLIQIIGSIEVATLISSTSFSGVGGDIIIDDNCKIQDIVSTGPSGAGNITIGKRCTILGSIDSSGITATGNGGDIVIGEESSVTGVITTFSVGLQGGDLALKSCFIHDVVMDSGAVTVGTILSNNSVIEGNIDMVSGASVFNNTVIINRFADCITNISSDTPQFNNCMFITKVGFYNAINASVPRNIIANNTLQNTDFGLNVTVLAGNNNVTNSSLMSPVP